MSILESVQMGEKIGHSADVVFSCSGCGVLENQMKKPLQNVVLRVRGNPGSSRDLLQLLFLSFVACKTRQVGAMFDGEPSERDDRIASRNER